MQNSNYFVTTAAGRFVLTLFESIEPAALDFYPSPCRIAWPVPACPVRSRWPIARGQRWRRLAGKPAALLTCLPGAALEHTGMHSMSRRRDMLARLHLAAAILPGPCPIPAVRPGGSGLALLPLVSPEERSLLADELAFQAAQDWSALPRGVIHADLFRDNVLWSADGNLTGLLDFYFAGRRRCAWLFDLAVVANDWCAMRRPWLPWSMAMPPCAHCARPSTMPGRRCGGRPPALLAASPGGRHRPRQGEVVTIKNPDEFRRL